MDSTALLQKKKHKKNYYLQSAKRFKSGIESGMKGILITCYNCEKQCVKEAYNLLNEYADILYGPENESFQGCSGKEKFDLEEDLENEIKALKATKDTSRFRQVNTKVKNIIFMIAKVPDPTELVQFIFEDAIKSRKRKTRYILKITPVTLTCKASCSAFKANTFEFIENLSKNDNSITTYKVICKVRHNSSVSKDHIIWYCREAVEKFLPSWSPSLTEPETIISVDVLQSVCCFGILKNFAKYKKYNLSEILKENTLGLVSNADISKDNVVCECTVNPVADNDLSAHSLLKNSFQESKQNYNSLNAKTVILQNCQTTETPIWENTAKLVSFTPGSEVGVLQKNSVKVSGEVEPDLNILSCVQSQSQDELGDIDLFFTVKQ